MAETAIILAKVEFKTCGKIRIYCPAAQAVTEWPVLGDDPAAKIIFGPGGGCVTDPPVWPPTVGKIRCTMPCNKIKNSVTKGGVPILRHEACHACDWAIGPVAFWCGAILDNCDARPPIIKYVGW